MAASSTRCTPKPAPKPARSSNIFAICRTASLATCAKPGSTRIPAYQRLALTDQLLNQANQALNLAQARYKLGLSSIIELSQSQLNATEAEIAQASAKYDYAAELSALNFQIGALQ